MIIGSCKAKLGTSNAYHQHMAKKLLHVQGFTQMVRVNPTFEGVFLCL